MFLDEDEKPLLPAHVCWNDQEANVIISVLRDAGIEGRANSEVPHSVLPIKTAGLGKVEVLVRENDLDAAKKAITDHLKAASD